MAVSIEELAKKGIEYIPLGRMISTREGKDILVKNLGIDGFTARAVMSYMIIHDMLEGLKGDMMGDVHGVEGCNGEIYFRVRRN
jgi:hypothetical protein